MLRIIETEITAISLSPRTLRVGQYKHISPSQGWLGIEAGVIQIKNICVGSDTRVPLAEVELYNEMELEGEEMGTPLDFTQEHWVEFVYKKGGSCHWLPLIILEDHVSVW